MVLYNSIDSVVGNEKLLKVPGWVAEGSIKLRKSAEASQKYSKSSPNIIKDQNGTTKKMDKNSGSPKSNLREKTFKPQASRLLVLMEQEEIRTVYYISIVLTILLFIQIAVADLTGLGRLRLGFEIFRKSFGTKIYEIAISWVFMFSGVLVLFYFVKAWRYGRNGLSQSWNKSWDRLCLFGFITYQVTFLIGFGKHFSNSGFPLSANLLLYCEQIRLLMKTHAFIREKVPEILHSNTELQFSKYLYFLFAPTLIYRDSYPRTSKINWKNVFQFTAEMVGILFAITQLAEWFLIRELQYYGTTPMDWTVLLNLFLRNNFVAGVVSLCGFYFLLHCWHNAWAEVLRFADREFYQDWWNSVSYQQYFRRWNIICHDWLYRYVYKDCYEYTQSSRKSVAAVFIISVIAHEYIMASSLGFFFPVMSFMFGVVGVGMARYSKILENNAVTFGRIVFWSGVFIGNNISFFFYTLEYYARQNCQSNSGSFVRFLDCYQR